MSTVFSGLDWASRTHAVCVLDERGGVCLQFDVAHDAEGLRELLRRLRDAGVRRIAIERPSGLLVDALVEAGLEVVPIHPNAVKASRPRYRSHGGKSDASDAYLLADLLRTDGHRFKPLAAQSEEIRALRALVRGRDDLVATRVQLANQLRSLLDSYWAGAAEVFADIDSRIALAFIQRYCTPESARPAGAQADGRVLRATRLLRQAQPRGTARALAARSEHHLERARDARQGATRHQPGSHAEHHH
jgi:transposase